MSQLAEVNRVYRGLRRRINNGRPLDSFPYLSGDSYFYSCQFYFKCGEIRKVPSRPTRAQKLMSVFLKVSEINQFISFLNFNYRNDYRNYTLVLHNGDDRVLPGELKQLEARFRKIYAVNLMSRGEKSTPIPIGLENKSYFNNGVPSDFRKLISLGLSAPQERTNLLLHSFSLHTNRAERELCSSVGVKLRSKCLENASPIEYRRALANSRFVLSPAGNGYDCHRTWEAMYLGAIPIVRRAHWPFMGLNLPVLVVDEWRDLLAQDLDKFTVPHNPTWNQEFWDSFYHEN